MADPVEIRLATENDVQRVAELAGRLRTDVNQPAPGMSADSIRRDVFEIPVRLQIYVAVGEGEIVGYASFQDFYEPGSAELGIHLCDIYVLPEARKRGIGLALMEAVSAEALRKARRFMWWIAAEENEAARGFYRSLGAKDALVRSYVLPLGGTAQKRPI